MIALQLSEDRISFTERRNQIIDGLHALPGQIKKVLELDSQLKELGATVSQNKSLLLMGRGYQCAYVPLSSPNTPDVSCPVISDTPLAWKVL